MKSKESPEERQKRKENVLKTVFGKYHTTADTVLSHPKTKNVVGVSVMAATILFLLKK